MILTMSSLLLITASSLLLVTASSMPPYNIDNAEQLFESFIQQYDRHYTNEDEKQARFEIFKESLERANRKNEKSIGAVFGVTKFSDLTLEEFKKYHTGLKRTVSDYKDDCTYLTDADIHDTDAPDTFDWRDHNVVTSVKDQILCGACYAFSSIGNIESQYAIKHKQLIELSEQQIIDCDKRNRACAGGFMSSAFRSLIEQGGSESTDIYPYIGISQDCLFDISKVKVKLADCQSFNLTSQEKLKQLLYHNGPISIGVKAEGLFDYIHGGIITDELCDQGDVNHAVLLVGYGNAENDEPYWIVKNSWGKTFGEDGYFRMHRGEGAHSCGMMNDYMASAIVV